MISILVVEAFVFIWVIVLGFMWLTMPCQGKLAELSGRRDFSRDMEPRKRLFIAAAFATFWGVVVAWGI